MEYNCFYCGKKSEIILNDKTLLCNECFVKQLIEKENENILGWENKGNAEQEQGKV